MNARDARRNEGSGRLRVGLMGAGRVARRFHLPILSSLPGIDLVAIADPAADARDACRTFAPRAAFHADFAGMLASTLLDAVVICLPPALHSRAAVASFAQGLHVYVEKPLATSAGEGREALDAWRRAGTVGMVGFNSRFHPLALAMKQALACGRVGEVTTIRSTFCATHRALPDWKRERDQGGGALLDLASHQVDLVRFLVGAEVVEVSALVRSVHSEVDTAVAALRLSSGSLVSLCTSLAAVEEDRLEFNGSRGQLVLDRYRSSRLQETPARRDFRLPARLGSALEILGRMPRTLRDAAFPPREPTFAHALGAFVAAIRGRRPAAPDLDDGMASLAVVLAAERSAREGIVVAP